jgi:hypothetical protein
MVHAYFEYLTSDYPRGAGHGMLLVQLHKRRSNHLARSRSHGA